MALFAGIILSMFGISIMQLILATAMPLIVTEIGGGGLYGWVFSGYMLASLLTIPIFSRLADLYGKKKFYLLGMGLFAAGTLWGGLAPTMEHLIGARVVQGLGAGMMTPVSLAMVSELFPPERRGRMIGAFSFVQLLANLVSPLLGSWITRGLGWHWIFYITLCMVLAAVAMVALDRRPAPPNRPALWREINLAGGLLFGLFCVLVVSFSDVVSSQGQVDWTGGLLLLGTLVSGLGLAWNEIHHKAPILKLSFFRVRVLRQSIASALVAGAIMYGLVTLLPLCSVALNRQGYQLNESQALMVFMLGITVGLILTSRWIHRLTPAFRKGVWAASVIASAGLYYAVSAGSIPLFLTATGLLGLGLGGIMATVLIHSQNAVNDEDRTVLSGIVQLGRYLGAAVGIAILTGILPEVSQISAAEQFLGSFGLLVVMYGIGLVNEFL